MDKLQLYEMIRKRIKKPIIPDVEYSVLDYGVVADSTDIQTKVLQQVIDLASGNGGGRVIIPAGNYFTGALCLKSGVELHLESCDTILTFVNEYPAVHYPVVFTHWEATPCYNYSSLIYACDAHNIAVTGKGLLDGGADEKHWWNWHHQVEEAWSANRRDLQLEDRKQLRRMNLDGIPVEERVFGDGHFLRPNFIQLIRCKKILLQGITLKNSPMWQLNPVMCESLTVDGVTMSSHGPNNDGCDPESCSGVHITNCRFDTGDDCISLKSGRDRDGREAGRPCEYVLIENNKFIDGHGGVALGSEMSGGVRCVLAWKNHFTSPNLTYALRLKTNAKRGGRVEDIILADSVIDHVHGAAVHGTMLYEDGRNGDELPLFRNITIENIKAHGGDYGIFLEAFDEVPITGLVLRNIFIDGVAKTMHSRNWKEPVIDQVVINGKQFPRPGKVRILGVPEIGEKVQASVEYYFREKCQFMWETSADAEKWFVAKGGEEFVVPEGCQYLRVIACDKDGNSEISRVYRVLGKPALMTNKEFWKRRLICRGILPESWKVEDDGILTRGDLAKMLLPLTDKKLTTWAGQMDVETCMNIAIENGFLAANMGKKSCAEEAVTRQEMATVVMQSCGVNYRNASSTMPICTDVDKVANNYGTNVARALYFGFMELDAQGRFAPQKLLTMGDAVDILNRVADFAGI